VLKNINLEKSKKIALKTMSCSNWWYDHIMQARVESAIGYIKQHSRTSLVYACKPTRFWDDATKDFGIQNVFLWASPDTRDKLECLF